MKFFGGSSKQKVGKIVGGATRFSYTFTVHNLQPWPPGNRAIAIGWQRGKRRRGATRSVFPATQPGKLGSVIRFNEKFDVGATLYKDPSGSVNPSALGPFKKKCIILAVLETDGRTQATAALGRVVIDLSEFAAVDGRQETRSFQVACNKSVHSAVGDPHLTITIRCCWRSASKTGGASASDAGWDDDNSMSTDTTGSRMTQNLSSFLRFKVTGRGAPGPQNEQDLTNFPVEKLESAPSRDSVYKGAASGLSRTNLSMEIGTIPESPHENGPESPPKPGMAPPGPPRPPMQQHSAYSSATSNNWSDPGSLSSSHVGPSDGGASRLGPYGNAGGPMMGGAMGQRSAGGAAAGMRPVSSAPPPLVAEASSLAAKYREKLSLHDTVASELVVSAALDVCVHLGRVSSNLGVRSRSLAGSFNNRNASAYGGQQTDRTIHAPSRRLARTMLCMGPQGGAALGRQAVKLIESNIGVCAGDLAALAYWWTNVVHLRGLLTVPPGSLGMGGGQSGGSMNGAWSQPERVRWAADAINPDLQRIERQVLFDGMMRRLWEEAMLPAITGPPSGSSVLAPSTPSGQLSVGGAAAAAGGAAAARRAQQEAAMRRWFEGLDEVARVLGRMGSRGHIAQLRLQLLTQVLKRVDALLFHYLMTPAVGTAGSTAGPPTPGYGTPAGSLTSSTVFAAANVQYAMGGGGGGGGVLSDYDPGSTLWGSTGIPVIDDSCLPFQRGHLTFGTGMGVKMVVTRLNQWVTSSQQAALGGSSSMSSAGMVGGGASSSGTAGLSPMQQFPLLRAVADLLMMPKEMLAEFSIRRDVCQTLSLRSVVHILESFQPDEYASHDTLAPEILQALREEQDRPGGDNRPPLSDLSVPYRPLADEAAAMKVESGCEPGLDYNADSETELTELGPLLSPDGSQPLRMHMLHDLWMRATPRMRA